MYGSVPESLKDAADTRSQHVHCAHIDAIQRHQLTSSARSQSVLPIVVGQPYSAIIAIGCDALMSTHVSLAHRSQRRRVILTTAAATLVVGFLSYQYYRFLLRRRTLQRRAVQLHSASDLSTQLIPCYYALLQQYAGGLMDNCSVHSLRRVRGEVVVFCAGGWSAVPPSRYPIPSYEWEERRGEGGEDERKARLELFWLGRCVGKGRVFNASFAFYLALLLRRQQSSQHTSTTPLLSHLSQPVLSLSLHIGRFTSSHPPPLSVSCEIGRIDHDALHNYRATHWGMDPDWEGSGLAECLQFGCGGIEAYCDREGAMPAAANAEVDEVVWKRVRYPWTEGRDVWLSVTTRDGTFHFDLTSPVHTPPAAYHTSTTPSDTFTPVLLPALQRHRPDLLLYAPPHPSCFKPAAYAPTPAIAVLSEAEWRAGGGRSDRRVIGADAVIEWVQSEVLLNESELSAEYVQVEADRA